MLVLKVAIELEKKTLFTVELIKFRLNLIMKLNLKKVCLKRLSENAGSPALNIKLKLSYYWLVDDCSYLNYWLRENLKLCFMKTEKSFSSGTVGSQFASSSANFWDFSHVETFRVLFKLSWQIKNLRGWFSTKVKPASRRHRFFYVLGKYWVIIEEIYVTQHDSEIADDLRESQSSVNGSLSCIIIINFFLSLSPFFGRQKYMLKITGVI